MDGVPIFLNEKSYPIDTGNAQLLAFVRTFLRTLYDAKEAAGEICLGGESQLSDLDLTGNFQTLASTLKGADIEWWRFIRSIDQRSPFSGVPQSIPPPVGIHVDPSTSGGEQGLLWAHVNESFLLSFASSEEWRRDSIQFSLCSCVDQAHGEVQRVEVCHLSLPNHAERWSEDLRNFRYSPAASSVIFDNGDFALRMYLNDHNPPHVHVYVGGVSAAIVRFDRDPEVLRGRGLRDYTQTAVFALLSSRRNDLMASWNRCRIGQLPFEL
jgi:Domain of unknown function (DUF4160)